jgi:hypothetical protein
MRRPARRFLFALATSLVSLALLGATVVWANFAPGPGLLVALLALPLTLGLPTTLATMVITSLWPGSPHLWLFAVLCLVAGVLLQFAVFTLLARWRRARA